MMVHIWLLFAAPAVFFVLGIMTGRDYERTKMAGMIARDKAREKRD